ncbi:MAG TPA: aldo/keto reductase [Candidatus Angelobacter sp.]|nr:aldo/keto reductase [Candidatus Angelobacter sp.]
MNQDPSRRKFLEKLGVGTAASLSLSILPEFAHAKSVGPNSLPSRTLGRTAAQVSILAFGCGSRFLMYEDEEKAEQVLNHAIDQGITYLDTAYSYGDGKSETRVGKLMTARRKDVWLATKIPDRTRDAFLRRLDASLKRLQVSQVDLVHIHGLANAEDLAAIEAPNGAMEGLLEAREQKMARFIGITSHTSGEVMVQAIEHNDLDCVQMALNASRNGRFEELALPAAKKKNLGIIAMKVTGQEFLLGTGAGKTTVDALLHYSLSLPVSTAVVGMPKAEMLDHNIAVARNFSTLNDLEMQQLREMLNPSRSDLEKRLVGHLDGPTENPGFFSV